MHPYLTKGKLHIVAVTAVIRNQAGKYFLLKRSPRELAFPGLWSFPGGKVEREETLDQALAKEILEESGMKMKPGKIALPDTSFTRPNGLTVKVLPYLVEVDMVNIVVPLPPEFTDCGWFLPEEILKLERVPGIEEEVVAAERVYASGIDLNILKRCSK